MAHRGGTSTQSIRSAGTLNLILLCVLCPQSVLSIRADALLAATGGDGRVKQDAEQPEGRGAAAARLHAGDADMGSDGSGAFDAALQLVGDAWNDADTATEFLEPEAFLGVGESAAEHVDESMASSGANMRRKLNQNGSNFGCVYRPCPTFYH